MSTSVLPGARPDRPEEECAVFGVFAPGEDVARMTCFGLQALQHRGQESAGIAVGDGETMVAAKDLGLVTQVFDEATLAALEGFVAVGHVRYSTSGGAASWEAAQPHISAIDDVLIALAHNGTLVNTNALRARLAGEGVQLRAGTDSEAAAKLIGQVTRTSHHLREGIRHAMQAIEGAYAMVLASPDSLYAFRDPNGIRPLCIGALPDGRGWVVSSETCGLDIVGATYVRDVKPGEIVRFNADGLHAEQGVPAGRRASCIFEYVYFARPDSIIDGQSVYQARRNLGRILAQEAPVEADLVLGVPDSGVPPALGFAQESGIPYADGIVKNRYVGRTFIEPTQAMRQLGIRLKLNPLPSVIGGKRIVVIDDSIVRGNTSKKLVQMLRDAGATEVHLRIVSPEVEWPCFYGIDTDTRDQLIAANKGLDEMNAWIGSDSLAFVSLDGLHAAVPDALHQGFCDACFTGDYPVAIPDAMAKKSFLTKKDFQDVYAEGAKGTGAKVQGEKMTERINVNAAQNDGGPHMPSWMDEDAVTYAQAGVDTAEGARAVEAIKGVVHDTYRPEVVGDIGGFGGLFSIAAAKDMADPLLVSGTDGVGTKLKVAQMAGKHDTVGIDLVAMCANDILATGAEPLFFLDYVAIGKLKAENVAEIVAGIGEGCKQAGCALIGGEMAEHPGVMDPDDYDLSGFCVGVVDRPKMLDPESVRPGDALVGLASSGLHSNGYSLARKVCVEGKTHYELRIEREELGGSSLQDALLEPTRIYVKPVRSVLDACPGAVRALAHITGGGISENLDRALPAGCDAEVDLGTWPVPPIARFVCDAAHLDEGEALKTFNMGLGMVLVVDPVQVGAVEAALAEAGETTYRVGRIVEGEPERAAAVRYANEGALYGYGTDADAEA